MPEMTPAEMNRVACELAGIAPRNQVSEREWTDEDNWVYPDCFHDWAAAGRLIDALCNKYRSEEWFSIENKAGFKHPGFAVRIELLTTQYYDDSMDPSRDYWEGEGATGPEALTRAVCALAEATR